MDYERPISMKEFRRRTGFAYKLAKSLWNYPTFPLVCVIWRRRPIESQQPCVGKFTRDIVYSRLEIGVIRELETRNPLQANGRRKSKHHQWLSDDLGVPALSDHLTGVIALMRASPDWTKFYHLIQMAYPMKNEHLQLELDDVPKPKRGCILYPPFDSGLEF